MVDRPGLLSDKDIERKRVKGFKVFLRRNKAALTGKQVRQLKRRFAAVCRWRRKRAHFRGIRPDGLIEAGFSRSTLYRWEVAIRKGCWEELLDGRGSSPRPGGTAPITPVAWELLLAMVRVPAQLTVTECWRIVRDLAKPHKWVWPSRRTVQRRLRRRPERTAAKQGVGRGSKAGSEGIR